MAQITYTVPGVHCHHCAETIKEELGALDGIQLVEVDVAKKKVTVTFVPPASPLQIEGQLADINYPHARPGR